MKSKVRLKSEVRKPRARGAGTSPVFGLRLDPDLKKALVARADKEGIPASEIARQGIELILAA